MKYSFIFALFLFLKIGLSQNLVLNPSFEDTVACPDAIGQINKSIGWVSPSNNTPDFFHACHQYGPPWFSNADVPNNIMGNQYTYSGNAYAGIAFFNSFQNLDYLGGELLLPLDSGKNYQIEFYVSLADSANLAIDKIGLAFTSTQYFENTIGKLNLQADIENNVIIDNDTGWTKISGTYIADGKEQYFILGLFRDTLEFDWDTTRYNPVGGYGAYYYVDDVSVTEIIDTTDTVNPIDTTLFEVTIFPNPNNGSFTLNYQLGDKEECVFKMYDAIGKLIYEEKLMQQSGANNIEIPLESGLYFLHVESKYEILKREKMVIQK